MYSAIICLPLQLAGQRPLMVYHDVWGAFFVGNSQYPLLLPLGQERPLESQAPSILFETSRHSEISCLSPVTGCAAFFTKFQRSISPGGDRERDRELLVVVKPERLFWCLNMWNLLSFSIQWASPLSVLLSDRGIFQFVVHSRWACKVTARMTSWACSEFNLLMHFDILSSVVLVGCDRNLVFPQCFRRQNISLDRLFARAPDRGKTEADAVWGLSPLVRSFLSLSLSLSLSIEALTYVVYGLIRFSSIAVEK